VARTETVTDRLGNATFYSYDARGNVLEMRDAEDRITRYSYDGHDAKLTETHVLNAITSFTTTYTYDPEGNGVRATRPTGVVTTMTHNERGQVLTLTLGTRVTTMSYDTRGNLEWVEDPLHHRTTHTYFASGQIETMTTAAGEVTRYAYDNFGYLTKMTD